jgi:dihydrofolate reductase
MSITVVNHLTFDGVMQSPAAPDEDTRGGFTAGGWAIPRNDQVMLEAMGQRMAGDGTLLLGRRTYEHFAQVWPNMPADNPYAQRINPSRKYVVSTTLEEPLAWENSRLVALDDVAAIEEDLAVLGSGELVQSLLALGLIDRCVLMIHPIVLGRGHRLFPDGGVPATFTLEDTTVTTTGVIIATYTSVERRP